MRAARLAYHALPGWAQDDHAAARAAFFVTADLLGPDWDAARTDSGGDARAFFERHFVPVLIGDPPALLTGYYEPELAGSRERTGRFAWPLHAPPEGFAPGTIWHDRAAIVAGDLLAGREIVWLDNPLEAFLAQVQGSVRIRLAEGGSIRLGYAGKNGHPYHSIGKELVARGEVAADAISTEAIRRWSADHPDRVAGLLASNPSYVFFRVLDLPEETGPLGTLGRPVTPGRTLAVDPDHHPLGAPVWVEAEGIARLTIAQDTGSAIKGPQRGDLYLGTGLAAGLAASALKSPGRIVTLLPHALAREVAP